MATIQITHFDQLGTICNDYSQATTTRRRLLAGIPNYWCITISEVFPPCQNDSTNTEHSATYNEANTLLKNNISRDLRQNYAREFTEDRQNFRRPNFTETHSSREHVTHGRYERPFLNNRGKQNNKSHKINNVKCANYAYSGPNPSAN